MRLGDGCGKLFGRRKKTASLFSLSLRRFSLARLFDEPSNEVLSRLFELPLDTEEEFEVEGRTVGPTCDDDLLILG